MPDIKRILVIDDIRKMKSLNKEMQDGRAELTYAETSSEGLVEIQKHDHFDEVWFDHDLGGSDTTRSVVSLLEELHQEGRAPEIVSVYVHTDNPAGGDWLEAGLKKVYGNRVQRVRISIYDLGGI